MIKWKFHRYYCIPNAIIRCKLLILPFPSPLTSDIVQTVPFDCVSGPKLEEERHILLPSGKLHLITTSRTWKGCSPLINFLVARCAFVGAPPIAPLSLSKLQRRKLIVPVASHALRRHYADPRAIILASTTFARFVSTVIIPPHALAPVHHTTAYPMSVLDIESTVHGRALHLALCLDRFNGIYCTVRGDLCTCQTSAESFQLLGSQ